MLGIMMWISGCDERLGIPAKYAEAKLTCMSIGPLAGMKKAAATDVVW